MWFHHLYFLYGKGFFSSVMIWTMKWKCVLWVGYGSRRYILVDRKVFAITTVDVYRYTPLLIFNAVAVFLSESNHRKCVKWKWKLGLKHMLGFLLAGNKCPNVIADKITYVLTHALTFGSNWEPGDTRTLRARY